MAFSLHGFLLLCGISGLLTTGLCDTVRVPSCPKNWHRLEDRCFLVIERAENFENAESTCQSLHGNLASIRNSIEDEVVRALLAKSVGAAATGWIGYTDAATEGTFVWTDGATETFNEFPTGTPPSNAAEDCVIIPANNSQDWDDVSCNDEVAYICSQDVQ
ncbi:alpha-N-acetylgalactosamine-specific lectin-like [Stigmatopora nigra]